MQSTLDVRRKTGWLVVAVLIVAVAGDRAGAAPGLLRLSVVSELFTDQGRALPAVEKLLDEAAAQGADMVLLPQECLVTAGEPIPGPLSHALAAKAKQHKMYVVGNLRESDAGRTHITSFLLDRSGNLVGKYRKSHKLPDENFDLGDQLPVFATEYGPVAMRIGTDRCFPEIDLVYAARGAKLVLWSQMPEPVEDEYLQDFPIQGRASDFRLTYACARYMHGGKGWITNFCPPYRGCPIGRSYVIDSQGERIASTPRAASVATAVIPVDRLSVGRSPSLSKAFAPITDPVKIPAPMAAKKRKIRVSLIEAHLGIDALLTRLDEAGRLGSDIACTYELVWIAGPDPKRIAAMTEVAKKNLARVAAKAQEHQMYVLLAGVVDRIERNEAILFGRDGKEVGRYHKIAKTHPEQIPGESAPVFETDFGRIGARICADEWMWELDRCFAIQGADLVFTPTQSWGPDAIYRDLRDISRAMDNGVYLAECTHPSSEATHRSLIVDPVGAVVARSEYRKASLVSAVIDLDNRPPRWQRVYKPHKPGGYLPEYQPTEMPISSNDLQETLLHCRRPELYEPLRPK